MTVTIIRRIGQAFLVVVVMSLIVFVGVSSIGDPTYMFVSPDADAAEIQRVIETFGFDRPIWERYWLFVQGAVTGDLGNSYIFGQPAMGLILQRMPATLELAFAALFLAIVLGIPLGLYAGLRPDSLGARAIMTGSIVGFSLPSFWVGIMLILGFAVLLGWLPATGRGDTVSIAGLELSFFTWDGLKHLALPAFNLALLKISLVIRLTRAGVREAIHMDYIKFARAKGLSPSRIVGVHLLKNIMIPVVTVLGLEFGSLIAFSVVTETIFAWPGMGKLLIESIQTLDRPIIVAYLMLIVFVFVIINLLVDLIYAVLDPRVRIAGQEG